MKRRVFAMAVVTIAATCVAYAGAQTPAPAQKKAIEKENKEIAEAAADKKINMKNLPPAVKARVEAEATVATVKGISSEKENGKTVYELETLVNGRTRDLMIDAAGKVYVVEEQLDPAKAPAPVRAAMEAKGRIVVLESVMQNGKTTYEGQIQPAKGKKIVLELNADGTPVKK
jgi:uncharacterized membrane protein YkoI